MTAPSAENLGTYWAQGLHRAEAEEKIREALKDLQRAENLTGWVDDALDAAQDLVAALTEIPADDGIRENETVAEALRRLAGVLENLGAPTVDLDNWAEV